MCSGYRKNERKKGKFDQGYSASSFPFKAYSLKTLRLAENASDFRRDGMYFCLQFLKQTRDHQ